MVSDLREEMRAAVFKSEIVNTMLPRMILFSIIIFLWNVIEPYGIRLPLYSWLGIFLLFAVILVWNAKRRTGSIMMKIDEIIDGRMDATGLLEQYAGGRLPLVGSLFEQESVSDELELLLAMNSEDDEYAKDVDWKGAGIYKTRGRDSRGPAKGKGVENFNENGDRIDAMSGRPEFDDLDESLTKTEKLVAEANEMAAVKALEEWMVTESKDQDLIEAGVVKLGDLVETGYFKGPQNKD